MTAPTSRLIRHHKTVGVISGCGDETCAVLNRWFFAKAEAGPTAPCAAGPPAGRETILGYPAIGVTLPIRNPRATKARYRFPGDVAGPNSAPARITMWTTLD